MIENENLQRSSKVKIFEMNTWNSQIGRLMFFFIKILMNTRRRARTLCCVYFLVELSRFSNQTSASQSRNNPAANYV